MGRVVSLAMSILLLAAVAPAAYGEARGGFDGNGHLLMHGSPRFVLGVYDSGGTYSTDQAFWENAIFTPSGGRGLQGFPLNVYLNYWLGNMPIGATNALLDVLHNHGMMYLATGNCFADGSWTRYGANGFSLSGQSYVQQFAQHPAALGYYIMDECDDALLNETKQHNQQLHSWDSQGVTFAATLAASYRDPAVWKDAADVLGTDPYPMYGAEPAAGYPHFIVADFVARLRAVARPDRPIWSVLQFFKFTSNSRMPKDGELRSHAVMSIVEGAQGLFWWDIGVNGLRQLDANTVSASMSQLKALTNELAGLEAALLAPASDGALVGNSTRFANPVAGRIAQLQHNIAVETIYSRIQGYQAEISALQAGNTSQSPLLAGAANVRTRTKVVNGVGYVFAYNYTNQSQGVTFTWQSTPTSVKESKTGQAYTVNGASWNDTFGPYEARIYVINGAGSGTPPPPPPPSGGLSVSFTNPASGATVSGTTTVTAAASGGSGAGYSYQIKVDGATVYSGTNTSFSWNTTTVGNGSHTLSATATDSANGSATTSRTVNVSNGGSSSAAGFSVAFSYPATGAAVDGAQSVGLSTTATWGQSKTFTLSLDGTVLTSQTLPGTTLWYTWDTTRVGNGSKTLTASVTMNGQTATTTLSVNVTNGGGAGGGGNDGGGTGGSTNSGRPSIGLTVSDRTPKAGDTTQVNLTVANPGGSVVVDAYFGVLVPTAAAAQYGCQGEALAFLAQGSSTFTIRCRSWSPATYPAYATGVTVPAGLPPTDLPSLFHVVWPSAPAGTYTVFLALIVPGSAADGTLAPSDIVVQATDTVTLSP
jgi:Big-like domain-containing protein